MSSPAEIRDQLAEVLHQIAGVERAAVRDTASLKDLGIDSLGAVELAEGLERSFNVTPPDVDVAEWRTVGDVLRTVTRQNDEVVKEPGSLIPTPSTLVDPDQNSAFRKLAILLAALGAALGIGVGVAAAALLATTGIGGGSMPEAEPPPPIQAEATPSKDFGPPSARETPEQTQAMLTATPTTVAPGQRFELAGSLADAKPGETLKIQMRSAGGAWEDFPVTVNAGDGGTFATELYTSRAGAYEFQVVSPAGTTTPSVNVTIGGPPN